MSDFQAAAMLLNAARNSDIALVEQLVNGGANVNYVDGTGLSVVCTAIMNNDLKAAQILQVYGADAGACDAQIRRYKNKLPKEDSGGLFSGLSNAQNMTLAAGGAALVIGGAYLLGDSFFGDGNKNNSSSSSSSSNRPNTGGGSSGGSGTTSTAWAKTANGPAYLTNQNIESQLNSVMNTWSTGAYITDWTFMKTHSKVQNYLSLMGGYAPFARGYTGQVMPRNSVNNTPIQLAVGGGMIPIPVALITANGIKLAGTAMDKEFAYAKYLCSSDITACQDVIRRYKNFTDLSGNYDFSLSGANTAFDENASWSDTLLAQIIIGGRTGDANDETVSSGDFIGFMPNGQLVLYRTGGGKKFSDLNIAIASTDTEVLIDGATHTITDNEKAGAHFFENGKEYVISNWKLYELSPQSYKNFDAMMDAIGRTVIYINGDATKPKGGVIANAAIPHNMKTSGVAEIKDLDRFAALNGLNKNQAFLKFISDYYYYTGEVSSVPGNFFISLNNSGQNNPFVIFSAGEYDLSSSAGTLTATLDNAAPLLYGGLNHHFMTAVAVQYSAGTVNISNASEVPHSGKYVLANYTDSSGSTFAARACGAAGLVQGGVDPWCFASAGTTGEQAVSTLAGAVGIVQSAFNYMTNDQIFTLLALTADGKFYGASELNDRYQLPSDFMYDLPATSDTNYWTEWKKLFNKAFGYGMVNLERATQPGKELFFYSSNHSTKDGYWSGTSSANRAATVFMPSSAFGGRAATIQTPMFDFVESADGTESMPRVFDMSFSFGGDRYGLNLTSLLGEISLDEKKENENLSFQLLDNGREIKNMRIGFAGDGYGLSADYRGRRGDSTFSNENPVMSLAGDALSANMDFQVFDFGFRFSAFGGSMTDEALLGADPAISNNFMPAKLGNVYGFNSSAKYGVLKFGFGYMDEYGTTLGAYSGGLFDFGGGKTVYAAAEIKVGNFTAQYTAARTKTNPGYGFISNVSDLYSDSYGINADFGRWSFNVSRPLAITKGTLEYMNTDYELVESSDGYDLNATPYLEKIDLSPDWRETRLAFLYRPEVSERTKLAFGFVERLNPGNMAGHEEILVLKFHRIW
ncbi:MAG: ankyrin repeat domain-containing protein [Rickettsiales bacterium]|nr:ankyrin repeat domain-containing protein [Rickettsiales bacterium]